MQSLKVSGYIKKISRQLTEHLTVLVIIISVALISFVGIFLYKNFYMTIISAKKIIILQQEVAPGVIKNALLENIKTNYNNKQALERMDWEKIEKIFITPMGEKNVSNSGQKSATVEVPN